MNSNKSSTNMRGLKILFLKLLFIHEVYMIVRLESRGSEVKEQSLEPLRGEQGSCFLGDDVVHPPTTGANFIFIELVSRVVRRPAQHTETCLGPCAHAWWGSVNHEQGQALIGESPSLAFAAPLPLKR